MATTSPDVALQQYFFPSEGLSACFSQFLLYFSEHQIKLGWRQPQQFTSHTHKVPQYTMRPSVSTIMQWRMHTTFYLLHTLLGAASRSAEVSTAGSNRLIKLGTNPSSEACNRDIPTADFQVQILCSVEISLEILIPDSLSLQHISLPSKHSLGLQLPHNSQTLLIFSLFVLIWWWFLFILIFAKPFVKTWF